MDNNNEPIVVFFLMEYSGIIYPFYYNKAALIISRVIVCFAQK